MSISLEPIYSVSDLNEAVKTLLEENFSSIMLNGEISNFSCPSSGHWYFTLKDEKAQIRCAMFRQYQQLSATYPKDGMHVQVRARVSLYSPRGDYQLIVSEMLEAGEGQRQRHFELLKEKLNQEGLFDKAHKKSLPLYPRLIGIITSATGAALQDVLTVLKRRYPIAGIIVYPSLVQGDKAADNIVTMLNKASAQALCDVLLLIRGGGSLEDLWPFNEERVARAIYACNLPIITGIGHEIDFTIADFVADVRAPTPSAAAEIATPDQMEVLLSLKRQQQHLHQLYQILHHQHSLALANFAKRLQKRHPNVQLSLQQERLKQYEHKIMLFIKHKLADKSNQAFSLEKQLSQLNPLNVLERGYAIVLANNKAITSIHQARKNDNLTVRLKDGIMPVRVLGDPS